MRNSRRRAAQARTACLSRRFSVKPDGNRSTALPENDLVALGIHQNREAAPSLFLRLCQELHTFYTEFAVRPVEVVTMQGEGLWFAHRLALMFPLLAHGKERQFCRATGRRDRDPAYAQAWKHLRLKFLLCILKFMLRILKFMHIPSEHKLINHLFPRHKPTNTPYKSPGSIAGKNP